MILSRRQFIAIGIVAVLVTMGIIAYGYLYLRTVDMTSDFNVMVFLITFFFMSYFVGSIWSEIADAKVI